MIFLFPGSPSARLECDVVGERCRALCHRSLRRPSDHILQRTSIGTGLLWRPRRLALGSTHFGSIKSFVQASTLFSLTTDLSVADRTWANAALALLGTNRRVGHLRLQISLREGKVSETWPEPTIGIESATDDNIGGFAMHFLLCDCLWEMATRLRHW